MAMERMMAIAAGAVMASGGPCGLAAAQDAMAPTAQPAESQPDEMQPAETSQANLPDGFAILERHIEASGGAERGLALEGLRMSGTMDMPAMGMNSGITISFGAPAMQLIEVTLGAMGKVVQGTNGEVSWAAEMPGADPVIIEGAQAEMLKEQARFKDRYTPRAVFESAETVAKEEIDGESYFRVEMTHRDGEQSIGLFSQRTGLQHKEMVRIAPNAPTFASEVTFDDYRAVDGMVFAHRMTIVRGGMQQVVTFTEIEIDPEFEAGTFSPPGEN